MKACPLKEVRLLSHYRGTLLTLLGKLDDISVVAAQCRRRDG
jgi:hypothetical protein